MDKTIVRQVEMEGLISSPWMAWHAGSCSLARGTGTDMCWVVDVAHTNEAGFNGAILVASTVWPRVAGR